MKNLLVLCSFLTLFISHSLFGQAEVTRSVGSFKGIVLQQNIEAELYKGESNKVILTISGVKVDKVTSEIVEGNLTIGFKKVKSFEGITVKAKIYSADKIGYLEANASSSAKLKGIGLVGKFALKLTKSSSMDVDLTVTDLKVNVSGSSKLNMTAKTKDAKVSVSSSSKVQLDIESTSLDAKVASKARLDINGKAETLKVNATSSAKYMGYGLTCKSLTAESNGNGYAQVTVTESILANVVSGGKIYYKGDPADVKVNATSSGTVEKAP